MFITGLEKIEANWLTDPEIEEMEAALAGNPILDNRAATEIEDAAWEEGYNLWVESVWVDPAEKALEGI